MADIARWYATEGDGVPWVVMQDEGQMINAIAECGTKAHAEMIARALNSRGAVGRADDAEARLTAIRSYLPMMDSRNDADAIRALLDADVGGR